MEGNEDKEGNQPIIGGAGVVGDDVNVYDTHSFRYDGKKRPIFNKLPNRHRWIAVSSYNITYQTAKHLVTGVPEKVQLDQENLASITFGCVDCEIKLTSDTLNTRCPIS